METKLNKLSALRATVCAAALVCAGAANAQDFPSTIEFNLDWNAYYEMDNYNSAFSEGALGASNNEFEQTGLSQLNNAAARIAAGEGLSIDLNQYTSSAQGGIALSTENYASAWTTQLGAELGGSQVGVASFNTASFDVTASGDADGFVELWQTLDGDGPINDSTDYVPFDFDMNVRNQMDVAVAYAGTATLDAALPNPSFGQLIDNPDYIANEADRPEGYDVATPAQITDTAEFVNGVQQAMLSLNTLRGTADADTTVELYGQSFDVQGFSGRSYYDDVNVTNGYQQNFQISGYNEAIAFSPRPATVEFVDPGLVDGLSDPSIANLDQIAAVSLNTMSFGEAGGTADFSVLSLTDNYSSADNTGTAQAAYFNDYNDEVRLGNRMLATTDSDQYSFAGGDLESEYMYEREYGIGDVGLSDVSQTAALTVNSISQQGEGALTLKDGSFANQEERIDFAQGDFVQTVGDLNLLLSEVESDQWALNIAKANTNTGDSSIDGLTQVAQFGFNSISSGGDINGWNESDHDIGILQTESGSANIDYEHLNFAGADSWDIGSVSVSGIDQVAQISFNTLNADGDMNANLEQDMDVYIDGYDDANQIDLNSDEGDMTASDMSQVALVRLNSVSVEGTITAVDIDQDETNLDLLYFSQGLNDFYADGYDGNVSVDGLSQVAQLSINTVSAGAIDPLASNYGGVHQNARYLGDDGYLAYSDLNEIDVSADNTGNASLKDAAQTFVLNLNSIASSGAVSGDVSQNAEHIYLDIDGADLNSVEVYAEQDLAGLRNNGGNATIDGLTQTLASNVNTFSAESLSGVTFDQNARYIDTPLSNYAMADAEWGVASADGIVQTAINRVNYMSITTPAN